MSTVLYAPSRMWHMEQLGFCKPVRRFKYALVSSRFLCSTISERMTTVVGSIKTQSNPKQKLKLKAADTSQCYDSEDPEKRAKDASIAEQNSKNISRAIYATKLGAIANLGLATTKGIAGALVSSTALIAGGAVFQFKIMPLLLTWKTIKTLLTVLEIYCAMR